MRITMTSPSDLKTTHYMFSRAEVCALYRLIEYEFTTRDDQEIVDVVNRISAIVRADELASTDNQTT